MLAGGADVNCTLSGYGCQEYGSWPQPPCRTRGGDKQDLFPGAVFLDGDTIENSGVHSRLDRSVLFF